MPEGTGKEMELEWPATRDTLADHDLHFKGSANCYGCDALLEFFGNGKESMMLDRVQDHHPHLFVDHRSRCKNPRLRRERWEEERLKQTPIGFMTPVE
jgi:hypothetical protein